jgi:hypothetical protein
MQRRQHALQFRVSAFGVDRGGKSSALARAGLNGCARHEKITDAAGWKQNWRVDLLEEGT